jgi:iron(III) transport system permease protein
MKPQTCNPPELRPYSPYRKFRNVLKNTVSSPYNIIVIISIILLAYLILIPLFEMIRTTFTLARMDVRRTGGTAGEFTFYYWNQILKSPVSRNMLYRPLANSFIIAINTSIIGILLGSSIAWLMVRSDLPFKRFFSLAVIIPYMLPSWTKSMAWMSVFRNERIGGSRGFLSYLGVPVPDWLAYGPVAIIAVLTVHYYAYSYLLVSAALRSVNSEYEEMGELLGADKYSILSKITFPLVLPAMLSSFILTFSKSMGTFGVPSFLGTKIGYYTVSTMLHSTVKNRQTNLGFTISLILIAIAAINIIMNQKLIGSRRSYVTIGGKGARSNPLMLGKWKIPITIGLGLFIVGAVIMPLFILVYQSFMLRMGDYGFSNFTLHYWIGNPDPLIMRALPGIFKDPQFWKYISNTMKLIFITSTLAAVCGQIIGYINSRGRNLRSGKLVEQLVFIPYLIPSIAFGAMYLSMFASARQIQLFGINITLVPALYGTFAVLVLVSVVKHLPFASRAGTANMMQIGLELEEAGQIAGAGFLKRFTSIMFPLSKNGFMSGFMLIFISIMKELDLIVILMTPTQTTLPFMAYTYSVEGYTQAANAVVIVMFVIVFFVYWLANKFFNADIAGGLGGGG